MPVDLTYDTLPPGSRLRREVSDDGSITISMQAGEVNEGARRAAARDTSVFSACWTALFVAIAWLLIDVNVSNRWAGSRSIAALMWIALAIFFIALFLLIWKILFALRQEALDQAAAQTTVITVRPGGLLIETSGPLGKHSETIDDATENNWGFGRSRIGSIDCFRIERGDKQDLILFPALSTRELNWIYAEVSRAIRRPRM